MKIDKFTITMFRIFENKTREERLCDKYSRLMQRSYKIALIDKEKSDRLNDRARKILAELKRMKCDLVETRNETA
ncbi:Lacal_2735 family protein [Gramella sp. MT6]|uniref:Lacal_2735 family protein n=1 Tax=Gramella sp. MT6 TaxID=2705471 RepID=UPI00214F0D70|nr:Lacal_2735 family protein [Gramella sp. MT6]